MATLARVVNFGIPKVPEIVGLMCVAQRHKSTSITTTNYKRGTGGRSSFNGSVVTVFGAKSSLGYIVVNKLGKVGSQVICAYRGDPYYMRDFKLMGDLGQILFAEIDLRDEDSLRRAMQYSNVVINLIGNNIETKNFTFHDVHVTGAQTIARLAKEYDVEKFVHISALNAGKETSNIYKGGSKFLKAKLEGEQAVREEFPEAIIFRPSDMIGLNDRFSEHFTAPYRTRFKLGAIPARPLFYRRLGLWKNGQETVKMPVKREDVAMAIVNALKDPEAAGKTFQAVGPYAYTLSDLVDYIFRCKNIDRPISGNIGKDKRVVWLTEMIYKYRGFPHPKFTSDVFERETITDTLDPELPTIEDLGVSPVSMEECLDYTYRPLRHYGDTCFRLDWATDPGKLSPLFPTLQNA
ncbi:NADH dehydrogenase [ubiquinone] 1 alpha subcomplex subunit 9, mitochondrial-like [Mercenaria mercenaria]|uniref:NADH dehydrogenase [ubiquinone] 1 alpha subcomplex subunit 9, mitochondrial-like n=1 Tax=Mercenaria mercenaria TaxID=6596 RepID=UPI00234E5E54|nr:NADH dehydrogenase [ubiquinone] 1 alpha subcomplex subunit 9, mitochondrial-like [Mercenaria mercenaria]